MKHHRLEHADKMPHTCEVCGKGFALKTKLKDHMIGHSDDLPFVCETSHTLHKCVAFCLRALIDGVSYWNNDLPQSHKFHIYNLYLDDGH
jgi:hypothetical protein